MEKRNVLGIDIGGSHITAALVDLETGTLIHDSIKRSAVNSGGSQEEILTVWCEVINAAFGNVIDSEKKIGIAFPGPFDYGNGISLIKNQDKFKALYQVDIKKELAKRLAIKPSDMRFMNDATAFMQGEVCCGAAKGYQNALGLTLGTGLGSAIAVNGIAKDADLWNSSFLGGIAEDYLSTRWFVNKYKTLTGEEVVGVKELVDIVKIDPFARQVFNEFGRALGHFLVDFINANKSDIVVLGGNISKSFHLFAPHLIGNLEAFHLNTIVKATSLNEYAPLIGAASSWNLDTKKNKEN
ncbi:ROK family protein [Pedobacter frigiditerrae]|uniref:ROK family protein n=1 Tax=Pedobacter frigiditerrae TaxID=2530452 RepID=A0A4R0MSZ1_9SPHI|nr:ROK family protein [Pedobacter frigiditerrae]TCC90120.1 ROK family protein [Pedobacter frigiditerrae]